MKLFARVCQSETVEHADRSRGDCFRGHRLNDAYNSSPTAAKAALDVLGDMKGYHRRIAVLGDMLELGQREEEFHAEIGITYLRTTRILCSPSAHCLFTARKRKTAFLEGAVLPFTDKEN